MQKWQPNHNLLYCSVYAKSCALKLIFSPQKNLRPFLELLFGLLISAPVKQSTPHTGSCSVKAAKKCLCYSCCLRNGWEHASLIDPFLLQEVAYPPDDNDAAAAWLFIRFGRFYHPAQQPLISIWNVCNTALTIIGLFWRECSINVQYPLVQDSCFREKWIASNAYLLNFSGPISPVFVCQTQRGAKRVFFIIIIIIPISFG